jgi:hypothetical protein
MTVLLASGLHLIELMTASPRSFKPDHSSRLRGESAAISAEHLRFSLVLDFQCHHPGDQDDRKELTHQRFEHHESAGERTYGQDVPEAGVASVVKLK